MNLFGIGSIVETVGKVADDLITSDEERGRLELENRKLDQTVDLAQIEVNKTEAAHRSIFVAGWRPFIGWVCGGAFAWHFIGKDFIVFALTVAGEIVPEFPEFDMASLLTVLGGLLGLGTLRTVEKSKGLTK